MKKIIISIIIFQFVLLFGCTSKYNEVSEKELLTDNEFSFIALKNDSEFNYENSSLYKINFDDMSVEERSEKKPKIISTNSVFQNLYNRKEHCIYYTDELYIQRKDNAYELVDEVRQNVIDLELHEDFGNLCAFYYDESNLKMFFWNIEKGGNVVLKYVLYDMKNKLTEERIVKYNEGNIFSPSLPPINERIIINSSGSYFLIEQDIVYFDFITKETSLFLSLQDIKTNIPTYKPSDTHAHKFFDFGIENELIMVSLNADNELVGSYIGVFDINKKFVGYIKINKNKIGVYRTDQKKEYSVEISPNASDVCLPKVIK